jgi:hypothetical protein
MNRIEPLCSPPSKHGFVHIYPRLELYSYHTQAHPPRNDANGFGGRQVLVVPYNALLSGPTAGAPWGNSDPHPRAISDKWWETVCPASRRIVIKAEDVMSEIGRESDGSRMLDKWTELLRNMKESCVEIIGTQVFDVL